MPTFAPLPTARPHWAVLLVFVCIYPVLDWVSFIDPLLGLNITPWNPDPALGLVLWLRYGRRAALPWFVALVLGEWLVRGLPAGLPVTLVLSAWLIIGYGITGELLRRRFSTVRLVATRHALITWLAIMVGGLVINAVVYVGLLAAFGLVPMPMLDTAMLRFGVGDVVGGIVTMPLALMLASYDGRRALAAVLARWETAGYVALALLLVWGVFHGVMGRAEFKHYYFLFLPIVWAATRQGMAGTALVAVLIQFGIIVIVRTSTAIAIPFTELQLLDAALALVGFFIGVMVDEQRQAADELRQSLRLAAAGEMAAALAHELNQPMTALAAYGKACDHLLARGESGPLLIETMHKMVREADRASEVVKRLREFFRTGAMHLETVDLAEVVATVMAQFEALGHEQHTTLALGALPALAIRADRLQIELVLRNLIANGFDAVQARPAGARHVIVSALNLQGGRLRVSVEDSGPGVSAAVAARLFEPFVSGKSSGLGLGLVLSRAIVEAHGGTLWAQVGERGVFQFILPLAETGRAS
jgi:two-component system sensor kinase FixL